MHDFTESFSVFVRKFIAGKTECRILFFHERKLMLQFFRLPQIIGIQIGNKPSLCQCESIVSRCRRPGIGNGVDSYSFIGFFS